MDVLALDFDGVLCNSSREVLVVAADAYAKLRPGSPLLPALRWLRARVLAGDDVREDALAGGFADLLPLGNRAEDFGVALWILEHELSATDQDQYDAIYEEVGEAWRTDYHRVFYDARAALRDADPEEWLALHRPYPELGSMLRRHRGSTRPAVVTAKDAQSVRLLLVALEIDDIFEAQLVLDKETGVHKARHLEVLQERTKAPFSQITFVDDKVNHLQKTSVLGIRPVLAGWGFNTTREHELAHNLGYQVATLANAEQILFKGATE
jgi:phosphoglycolate phosphatase-like HAD superfamily hydrolase